LEGCSRLTVPSTTEGAQEKLRYARENQN
jgi:hypothetical protein